MPKIFGGGGLTAPVAATNIADGSVSDTEFQYLNNATSEIQSQLNSKLPLAGGTMSGDLLHSTSIRIGPNTSDGADNLVTTLGHADRTRGGYINCRGNEVGSANGSVHIGLGNAVNSGIRFYDSDGTSILMQMIGGGTGRVNIIFGLDTSGPLIFSGTNSSAGASTRNIHGNGGTTDLYANVPTGGVWGVTVNGTHKGSISGNGFVPGAGSTPGNENVINLNSYLNFACNSGYFGHAFYQGSSSIQALICNGGLQFPTAHSAPGNYCAIWRYGTSNPGVVIQSPTDGYSMLAANTSGASPRIYIAGTGLSGAAFIEPAPVSLAAAGTRTVMSSATTRSGSVEIMNTTDGKRATFSVENGTPVKIEGDASFVAGAPGASQIGLELSSTTLRINNGYAGAKLIAFIARLA